MTISVIMVPLDGAGIAASVLPTVASLARPIRAAVHLVAVVDLQKREIPSLYYVANPDPESERAPHSSDTAPLNPDGTTTTPFDTAQRVERARSYLASLATRLQSLGIESSYEAFVGDPMTDIAQLARRKRFGLIALSPHGRYAIGKGLGSVTDRVLHSSSVPLLIAPPEAVLQKSASDHAIQNVIVGLDGSRAAEVSLERAVQICKATGAAPLLLRAIGGQAREAAWGEGANRVVRDIDSDFRGTVFRYMNDVSERACVPYNAMVGDNDEVMEILDTAETLPSSIIVLASWAVRNHQMATRQRHGQGHPTVDPSGNHCSADHHPNPRIHHAGIAHNPRSGYTPRTGESSILISSATRRPIRPKVQPI